MTLLIDAFNLIYKFPDLEENMAHGQLVEARQGLLNRLLNLCQRWKKPLEIHCFFDGKKNKGSEVRRENLKQIQIYFSHDLSADHLIKEYIRTYPRPGALQVVSSDKDVLEAARKHKCVRKTSEEFAAWVNEVLEARPVKPEKSENPTVGADDVAYWEKLFREKNRGG